MPCARICGGSRVGCKAKHATCVPLQGHASEHRHVACAPSGFLTRWALMQQRESLLGAQTGKSVFLLIHLVKINLGPAMTRTVASKIETVRTGNLRLPKYEPIAPPTIAAAERINGMDCLALTKPARPAIEFTKINAADTADACFVFAQLEKSKRGVRKIPPPVPVRRRESRCLNQPRVRRARVAEPPPGDRRDEKTSGRRGKAARAR